MESRQDTFNESVSSILERKVRGWLSTVIDDMRRSSPVQQWLDSLPTEAEHDVTNEDPEQLSLPKSDESKTEHSATDNTVVETERTIVELVERVTNENDQKTQVHNQSARKTSDHALTITSQPTLNEKKKLQRDYSIQSESYLAKLKNPLLRDHSLQSDASGSSGSSVLNVLGARKVDAESVLLALGFGPSEKQQKLQRIPDRFLVPSKLRGISTEKFIKDEQHSMKMHDCGIFGYRGLTGNPHVPPSTIVAKIMECILQDEVCREEALMKARHSIADMRSPPAVHARLAAHIHLHHNHNQT